MKRILFTSILLGSGIISIAQTTDDAIRQSYQVPQGTARNMAIGGAAGSLGGDLTSAYVNPAGLGFYKTGEIVISPGFNFMKNNFNYRSTNQLDKKNNFAYGPTGIVFGWQNEYSQKRSSAISLSINQVANFNNRVHYKGLNNVSSWSEQYLEELARNKAGVISAGVDYPFGSSLAFYPPSTQSNPDLTVETSKEKEIGADLTLKIRKADWFNNLTLSTTVWNRTTNNAIYPVDAPPTSGGGGYLTNSFGLKSKGVTIALNLAVAKSKNFNWDFTANFNHQTTIIGSVSTGQDIIVTSSAGYGNYVLRSGSKIGQLYGLKTFTSVNQTKQDGTPYIAKADQGKYQLVNGYLVDTATRGLQFTNELSMLR